MSFARVCLLAAAGVVSAERYLTQEEMDADPFHGKGWVIKAEGPKCGDSFLAWPHGAEEPTVSQSVDHCEVFQIMIYGYDETLPEGSGGPYTYSLRSDCGGKPYFGFNGEGDIEVGHNRFPEGCQEWHIEKSGMTDTWTFRSVCYEDYYLGVWRDHGVLAEPASWVEKYEESCGILTMKSVDWDFETKSTPEIDAAIFGRMVSFQGDCGDKWYLSLADGKTPAISTELGACERFEVTKASDDEAHMWYHLQSMCGERRYLSIDHDHKITSSEEPEHCEMMKVTTAVTHSPEPTINGDCGAQYVPFISVQHDGTLGTLKKPDHCEKFKLIVHGGQTFGGDGCNDSLQTKQQYVENCFTLSGNKEACKAQLCKSKKQACAPVKKIKCRKLDGDEATCCKVAACRYKNGVCLPVWMLN